jgi:hypothetical protein
MPISNRLMQHNGDRAMTKLSNGTIVTDVDAHDDNAALNAQGYTIGRIEDWHGSGSCIVWDAPELTEADLPF